MAYFIEPGWNTKDKEMEMTCRYCGWEGEVVAIVDGTLNQAICPNCKDEVSWEVLA
jgi:hypothetical protein